MSHQPIEETELYRRTEQVADQIWHLALSWPEFARNTTGYQLVRAIDSVCANLSEGDGRYSDSEAIHFFVIARGSLREAGYFVRTAARRGLVRETEGRLLAEEIDEVRRMLNGLINYRRRTRNHNQVREASADYGLDRGEDASDLHASRLTPRA
ncbi:MAG TPA: four helix bundle protein [Fimbriimonas sp.]